MGLTVFNYGDGNFIMSRGFNLGIARIALLTSAQDRGWKSNKLPSGIEQGGEVTMVYRCCVKSVDPCELTSSCCCLSTHHCEGPIKLISKGIGFLVVLPARVWLFWEGLSDSFPH